MDLELKRQFIERWEKYLAGAELPIAVYYTNEEGHGEMVQPPKGHQCIIGVLSRVRKGQSLSFDVDAVGCGGGKKYLGFVQGIMPNFEYFLSYGIPGKLEGERYKKTPEMVNELMGNLPAFEAPGKYIVFKRWDELEATDDPDIVIFFARPDVLSGLFTLANFDEVEQNGVFAPFCAGCGSIVQYPYVEKDSNRPRGVLGMFDVSARPWVSRDELSFAVPMNKFRNMVENMDESFLITPSWDRVEKRIRGKEG
jgi:uncharacterized protein (DUF169 family)